jgi:hypothetical protein
MKLKDKVVILLGFFVLFGLGLKKVVDYQDYNPTVIVEAEKFQNQENKELLKGDKLIADFKGRNDNLGIISILFDTHSRINDDYLQFSIKEKGKVDWYYSNKYKVDQFQNNQYFPFGFPEIDDSKGKTYQVQIESLAGAEGNSVQMVVDRPLLSKYSFPKAYLLQNKGKIPIFILSKIGSFFTHIELETYLFVFLGVYLIKLINFNKLLSFLKKFNIIFDKKCDSIFIKIKKSKLTIPILIVICVLGLFIINLFVNGPIRLKSFAFSDDLGSWEFFNINRHNFFGFIFNTGANKFRPVFLSVFFVVLSLIGNKIWLFGVFNLLFNFFIATLLFFLFRKISKSLIVSLCLGAAFILSRFAYYNITQALGLMEAMALLFSIITIYLLWRYLNTENIKYFWASLAVFTMLIFTHERFITILGVYFVLFLVLGLKRKNILLFLISTIPVILSFILKLFVLQIRALDGTGGTNILQTFSISGFIQTFLSGWLYLFGINAGPTYLNGISSEGVPLNINNLNSIGNICLSLIIIIFGLSVFKSKKILLNNNVKNFLLFFTFIFVTLIAGSITFRLEMRWLYVPFVGLLFLLAYMFRVNLKDGILGRICLILIVLWLGVFIKTELFYRGYYKNLYYWGTQSFGNSLYEATLEKYGDDFWNYKTYIICDDCNIINSLFKQFEDKNKKSNIILVNDISKIDLINNNISVLIYKLKENNFIELEGNTYD